MPGNKENNGSENALVELSETQLMDSMPPLLNMNREISQANSLMNSSINVLHSCMKRTLNKRDLQDHDNDIRKLDTDKVHTVMALGRELTTAMKAKIDLMKLAKETGCYEYDVTQEEEEEVEE